MVKRTFTLLVVAAAAAVTGISVIPAMAAAPRGTLTSSEYSRLSSAEAKYVADIGRKPVRWKQLLAVCRAVGASTELLQRERVACLAQTELFQGLADFPSHESSCGTREPRRDRCMVPLYGDLSRYAKAMYLADLAEVRVATQRGFTGRCLGTLANTGTQLDQQRELASATAKITGDVQKSAEVVEGKLPADAIDLTQVDADAKAFERDVNLVLRQTGPKLSSCPHQ